MSPNASRSMADLTLAACSSKSKLHAVVSNASLTGGGTLQRTSSLASMNGYGGSRVYTGTPFLSKLESMASSAVRAADKIQVRAAFGDLANEALNCRMACK